MSKNELVERYCFNCKTGLYFCTCSLWDCPTVQKDPHFKEIHEKEVKKDVEKSNCTK